MKRAWALALLCGLSAAARAEKVSPRKDLSDPDQFKQFVEGSRERQGLPEEIPQASALPAPSQAKPLPAYTPPDKKAAIDSASVPRWKPVVADEAPAQKGFSTGRLAALGGIGAMAFIAGLSLRRSAELEVPLPAAPRPPLPEPQAPLEMPVDLEPLPPDAKA